MKGKSLFYSDCERWSRKSRVHRAKIRTADGTTYLHLPIHSADRKKKIYEVRIDQSNDWATPLLRTLEFNYRKSLYYDFYEPEIVALFSAAREQSRVLPFLRELNRQLFRFLELPLPGPVYYGSEMAPGITDPEKISALLSASGYLQDSTAHRYHRIGANAKPFQFSHPEYRQHFAGFEPGCSLLDLLFHYGPESFRVTDPLIHS